jgi:ParB-like nuclease domain
MAEVTKYRDIKGRLPVLQYLRPEELDIDAEYQRSIDNDDAKALIRRIAEDFNWDLCQPLVVSRRVWQGNGLFVIDGQHRLEAARKRGDVAQLPCTIVEYPSKAAEAEAFVLLNRLRRPLSRIDLFKAAVTSGDETALAIQNALRINGLWLAPHMSSIAWKPGQVGNIGGIEQAVKQHGIRITTKALGLLAAAFKDEVLIYAGTIFPGLVAICAAEFRPGRPLPTERIDQFARQLAVLGQTNIFRNIVILRGERPELGRKQSAIAYLSELYWPEKKARSAPAPAPAQASKVEAPARPSLDDLNRNLRFIPGQDGLSWCDQCDMRVTLSEAKSCRSRFCSFRRANAQG